MCNSLSMQIVLCAQFAEYQIPLHLSNSSSFIHQSSIPRPPNAGLQLHLLQDHLGHNSLLQNRRISLCTRLPRHFPNHQIRPHSRNPQGTRPIHAPSARRTTHSLHSPRKESSICLFPLDSIQFAPEQRPRSTPSSRSLSFPLDSQMHSQR